MVPVEGEGRLGTERNSKVSCLGCAVAGTVAAAVSSIEDLLSIIRMGWWRVSSGGGAPWVLITHRNPMGPGPLYCLGGEA